MEGRKGLPTVPWCQKTHRATVGGALTARELWLRRIWFLPLFVFMLLTATRVRGRTRFGASSPTESMAREASTLSLATCRAGFFRCGIDPVGETPTSPIPLLARVALWFHHPHRRAGHIHARRLSESIEAVAIARQACGYAQRCGNNSSGIQERCRGSGEVCASSRTPTGRVHGEWVAPSAFLAGVDEVASDLKPEQKVERIVELRRSTVRC